MAQSSAILCFQVEAVNTPTFGNTGRDILPGPGVFNLNASVFRTFAIRENWKLQFRAEAFGLTNTPQFGNPNTSFGGSTFGIISSSSGERQLRFALKLTNGYHEVWPTEKP